MSKDQMTVKPGKVFHTYSDDEVVWLHDPDHTPHNSRKDSDLKVQVRAPIFEGRVNYVSVEVIETTNDKNGNPRSKEIWFTMKPEHFDAIAAHVNRAKPDPVAILKEIAKIGREDFGPAAASRMAEIAERAVTAAKGGSNG